MAMQSPPGSVRLAIVRSSFYGDLLSKMEESARTVLSEAQVCPEAVQTVTVPGAFEIPLACQRVVEKGEVNGLIALGIIIQGETHHAGEIARACTDGLMHVQLLSGIPIAHGVLFVDSYEQALARQSKGAEAAQTLLQMLVLPHKGKKA